MELFQIEPSRPAHDALGDAYHTALICSRLDLKRGIREYEEALQSHENGFHGAELPGLHHPGRCTTACRAKRRPWPTWLGRTTCAPPAGRR